VCGGVARVGATQDICVCLFGGRTRFGAAQVCAAAEPVLVGLKTFVCAAAAEPVLVRLNKFVRADSDQPVLVRLKTFVSVCRSGARVGRAQDNGVYCGVTHKHQCLEPCW